MVITSQQFNDAYSKLPFPVREFMAGTELPMLTEEVGRKYGLHVDTVGALEREISNMLLGFLNPTQFVAELKAAGIAGEVVTPLTQDLNEKVFIPLHDRMMKGDTAESNDIDHVDDESSAAANLGLEATPVAAAPRAPAPNKQWVEVSAAHAVAPAPATPQTYQPPAPLTAAPAPMANVPPTPPIPVAIPQTPPPVPAAQRPFTPPASAAPGGTPVHDVRTMATDIAMMKSGAFHPQSGPPPVPTSGWTPPAQPWAPPVQTAAPPRPEPAVRLPTPQPIPAALAMAPVSPAPVPPRYPSAFPPVTPPAPVPPPAPVAPAPQMPRTIPPTVKATPTANENREALHAVLKEYGVDPYREPVE